MADLVGAVEWEASLSYSLFRSSILRFNLNPLLIPIRGYIQGYIHMFEFGLDLVVGRSGLVLEFIWGRSEFGFELELASLWVA